MILELGSSKYRVIISILEKEDQGVIGSATH
jgi:hypothetical protein